MRYIGFAELAANAWSAVALESILRVVAVAPEHFTSHYSLKMDWIRVRPEFSAELSQIRKMCLNKVC